MEANNKPQSQPQDNQPPLPKKKSRDGYVTLLVILILIFIGVGTAYAFKDNLINSFVKATKSPLDYYTFVENKAIITAAKELAPCFDSISQKPKNTVAYNLSSNVTFNKDTLDSLMKTSLGISITDLESQLGIPIDNTGFDAYLRMTSEDYGTNYDSFLESLTKERISDLLNRYTNIILDHINQVKQEDHAELSINTLSSECTVLIVTITEEDLGNMALAILEAAREDKDILELLTLYNLTKEDYQAYVDAAVAEINSSSNILNGENVQMLVYVDNKGNIIGRELSSTGAEAASLGYNVLSKKNYKEYNVYALDNTGATVFRIDGRQTKNDGSYDGSATVIVSGVDEYTSAFSFDINYEDFHYEIIDDLYYQYGSVSLSSLDLMGLQINMTFGVEDELQNNKIVFQMGAASLVTIDSTMTPLSDYELAALAEDVEVYDLTKAETYQTTLDIEGYISNLSDKLGVDLQTLFGTYLYGY